MKPSYAAYAMKLNGESSDTCEIVKKLFLSKDSDSISSVLVNYDEKDSKELRELILSTNCIAQVSAISPNFEDHEWKGSFWDINYHDRREEYYYNNFMRNLGGKFSIFFFESNLNQEYFWEKMRYLKGRTTFVFNSEEGLKESNIVKNGMGIRGMFTTDAVILSKDLIHVLSINLSKENTKVVEYLNSINKKDLLFTDINPVYQAILYKYLPVKMRDDLNSYRIHSMDNKEVFTKSLDWLIKKGKIDPKEIAKLIKIISSIEK